MRAALGSSFECFENCEIISSKSYLGGNGFCGYYLESTLASLEHDLDLLMASSDICIGEFEVYIV